MWNAANMGLQQLDAIAVQCLHQPTWFLTENSILRGVYRWQIHKERGILFSRERMESVRCHWCIPSSNPRFVHRKKYTIIDVAETGLGEFNRFLEQVSSQGGIFVKGKVGPRVF